MTKLKSFLSQLNEVTATGLIIAIVIVINYLLTLFPLRFDVTANRRFSLSSASKEMVRNIDDLVNIKVFVSKDLPTRYTPVVEQVKDLLWEYEASSSGKLKVEYFDPSTDPEAAQRANSLGIYPIQFSDISREKLEVSQGYLGLAVLYTDKNESISFIEDAGNLEYQVSSAISNLVRQQKPVLGFVTGHGERSINEDLATVAEALRKQYDVRSVDWDSLVSDENKGDELAVLIIIDPQEGYSEREKFLVDQFLMQNKAALFLLEGVKVEEGLQTAESSHNLDDYLSHYGVVLNSDLVLDAVNEVASFSDGRSTFFVQYPFWPKITTRGFNEESVITNSLEVALFPWTSSLTIESSKLGEGVKVAELVKSSPKSWVQTDNFLLNPTQQFAVPGDSEEKTLAVLLEGKLSSYYKGKSLPGDVETSRFLEQAESARMIVVGDASFALDRFARGTPSNFVLLANMLDYLSTDTALTSIRAKGQTFRPIKEVSDMAKLQIKYANIFGPSLVLALLGFVYMYRRKKV